MKHKKIEPLVFDTYIAVIKNSVGVKIWRNFYAEIDGAKQDIMRDGDLSCAFFVSSVLTLFGLIKRIHGTVDGTLIDMRVSAWRHIREPKVGSVLVWEYARDDGGDAHKHIGFYIGDNRAISNSSKLKAPTVHHWTFGIKNGRPKRRVEAIFWHPKLGTHLKSM